MLDLLPFILTGLVTLGVGGIAGYFAFRRVTENRLVALESALRQHSPATMDQRLARVETTLHHYPPDKLHERIRDVEGDVAQLEPIKGALKDFGAEAARRAFKGGGRR